MSGSSGESAELIRILAIGDVVGGPGRVACTQQLRALKTTHQIDFTIVNGENSSGGVGITLPCAEELRDAGADVITLGDHTWQRKEAKGFFQTNPDWCIRPANYPEGVPGRGWTIREVRGVRIAVVNLMGRVFIPLPLECPFRTIRSLLQGALAESDLRVLDMHAEATSEKIAMGRYIDGEIHFQFGTHTHVATADEQILPQGTGYITDIGMSGSREGVIGMKSEVALSRFLTGMSHAYEVAPGDGVLNGVVCCIDPHTKRTVRIYRVTTKELHSA